MNGSTTLSCHQDQDECQASSPKRRKQICLFGTSANPPTGNQGHVGIVKALSALKENNNHHQKFDEIRIVPVYTHPFASKRKLLAPFHHRMKMCQLAFLDDNEESATTTTIKIDNAEEIIYQQKQQDSNNNSNIRVGTADLLQYYHAQDNKASSAAAATNCSGDCDYTLCLGADTFLDFTGGKWQRTDEILNLIQGRFVVLYRKQQSQGEEINNNEQDDQLKQAITKLEATYGEGSIILLEVPTLGAVSSTLVRSLSSELNLPSMNTITADNNNNNPNQQQHTGATGNTAEEHLKQMVNDRVLQYVKEHQLYCGI